MGDRWYILDTARLAVPYQSVGDDRIASAIAQIYARILYVIIDVKVAVSHQHKFVWRYGIGHKSPRCTRVRHYKVYRVN